MIRIVGLRDLPPGLFCDEAGNGYNAYLLLHHRPRRERRESAALRLVVRRQLQEPGLHLRRHAAGRALRPERVQRPADRGAVRRRSPCSASACSGARAFGAAGGLIAALLLAVVPWHVHFSRIAFELIAFPAIFLFAFAALAAGVRGRPRWLLRGRAAVRALPLHLRAGQAVRAGVPARRGARLRAPPVGGARHAGAGARARWC